VNQQSLQSLLLDSFKANEARIALRFQGREFTYGQLLSSALHISAVLQKSAAPTAAVGIVGQRNPSVYLGILGSLFANCCYVPINTKYPIERQQTMIRESGIRHLVGRREDIKDLMDGVPSSEVSSITPEEISLSPGNIGSDELENTALADVIHGQPDDLCYIMFTSGSTGSPKSVGISQKNLISWLENMTLIYETSADVRASQTYDLSFDLSVADLFYTWNIGGALCILDADELMLPHEYIQRECITHWSSVPTLANFMFKMGILEPNCFPTLKHSLFCGEPLPMQVAKAWQSAAPNSTVENLYGPTEATIWIMRYVYLESDNSATFRNDILPIGLPFPNHEIQIVGQDGNLLSEYEEGEMVYKGPQVSEGYLNDSCKTASQFIKFDWDTSNETWYRSGDLGFRNSNGYFECLGRLDEQVKIAGRRIEIGEIESILRRFPKTQDAVVVPLRDQSNIVKGFAAFLTNPISYDEERQLMDSCSSLLEALFFPKVFYHVEEIPLTSSGKVDRKALFKLATDKIKIDS
jgi:D-alanine--poly(phosphoribitol) ligase subunit 1